MKTHCELGADWVLGIFREDGYRSYHKRDTGLTVEIEPLRSRHPDEDFELAAIVGASTPTAVRVGVRSSGWTTCGWPYDLIQVAVVDGAQLVEARVVATFEMHKRVTALRFAAPDGSTIARHHDELIAIVASVRPDWSGTEPAALAQLWLAEPSSDDPFAWADASGVDVIAPAAYREGADDPRRDYGRVVTRTPRCVIRPRDVDELCATLRFLRGARIPHTTRASAYSCGGQVLTEHVVVDLRHLDRVLDDDPSAGTIRVEGACTWQRVVDHLRGQGRRPRALVANLGATVGGVLAVGGFGDTSHIEGAVIDHVVDLVVVTPDGERVRVGPGDELFEYTLAGAGQLGVIAEVTLRTLERPLVLAGRMLRWHALADFVRDARTIATRGSYEFLRAWFEPDGAILACVGRASLTLPDHDPALDELSPATASPLERIDLCALLAAEPPGARVLACPALEVVLPLPGALELVPELLHVLDDAGVMRHARVGQAVGIVPASRLPLAPIPGAPGEHALVLAMLPELPESGVHALLPALREVGARALAAGGRIYLMSIPVDVPDFAAAQFGAALPRFRALKRALDPAGLLNPGLL